MAASKSRTVILTGGVAAITAMGAWYGATLKSDREVRQVCIRISSSSFIYDNQLLIVPP